MTILKLMEKNVIISQLMIQSKNMMKLEEYQQEKEMFTLQVVC